MALKTKLLSFIAALSSALSLAVVAADEPQPPAAPANGPLPRQPMRMEKWAGPDRVIARVEFKDAALGEVASFLGKQFEGAFDVVIPNSSDARLSNKAVADYPVTLNVRNVTAGEIFNAMSLSFEAAGTPLHWDLVMNGKRPTAVLQILRDPRPAEKPKTIERAVFFVGDLIDHETKGGMTIDAIAKTLGELCSDMGQFNSQERNETELSCHKEAELIVAVGSPELVRFVQDALKALRDKARNDRLRAERRRSLAREDQPSPPPSEPPATSPKTP